MQRRRGSRFILMIWMDYQISSFSECACETGKKKKRERLCLLGNHSFGFSRANHFGDDV